MPQSWWDTPRWNQLRTGMQQVVASVSVTGTASVVMLGLTLALMALAGAFESPLLFLLAVVQAAVLFSAHMLPPMSVATVRSAAENLWCRLPTAAGVQHAVTVAGTMIYRGVFRLAMCLLAASSAGLATLAWFVLSESALWRWTTLQTEGPPLGPLLLSGAAALAVLLISGWIACRTQLWTAADEGQRS